MLPALAVNLRGGATSCRRAIVFRRDLDGYVVPGTL